MNNTNYFSQVYLLDATKLDCPKEVIDEVFGLYYDYHVYEYGTQIFYTSIKHLESEFFEQSKSIREFILNNCPNINKEECIVIYYNL